MSCLNPAVLTGKNFMFDVYNWFTKFKTCTKGNLNSILMYTYTYRLLYIHF